MQPTKLSWLMQKDFSLNPCTGHNVPDTQVQVVLVAQHTFVTSDPWTATMVGSEVAEDSLLEAAWSGKSSMCRFLSDIFFHKHLGFDGFPIER